MLTAAVPELSFSNPTAQVVGTLLITLRITAFLVVAPPFSNRAIPARVKALLGFAIALAVYPSVDTSEITTETGPLLTAALWAVLTGAGLGFLVFIIFIAVQAAGDLLDVFGGFQLASAFDPLMQVQTSVFGRFYGLLATTLMFASEGYLILLMGLRRTFDAIGVMDGLSLRILAELLTDGAQQMTVAALQIAGPLIAILFLTDVGLGLLTRAAPALNPFALGFPLKILVTLSLATVAVAVLPAIVEGLTDDAARQMAQLAVATARADTAADAAAGAAGVAP